MRKKISEYAETHRKDDVFGGRFRSRKGQLSPSALRVAEYIDDNREAVLEQSALQIGEAVKTSDATVIRTIQSLGFSGLVDLKETLKIQSSSNITPLDKVENTVRALGSGSLPSTEYVFKEYMTAFEAVRSDKGQLAIERAISLLNGAQKVGVFGLSASGAIAQLAIIWLKRLRFLAYPLTGNGIALADQLLDMRAGDVVIMIVHRRGHREAITTADEARRLGVPIVLIAGSDDTPLQRYADVTIVVPRSHGDMKPVHGAVLTAVEILMLALARRRKRESISVMERIQGLRDSIRR